MTIHTPITKARLRNHFAYGLWKYALAAALSIFIWDLIFTTTAYRSPEDKRVDVYLQTTTASEDTVEAFMEEIKEQTVPDMETVETVLLSLSSDDYYSSMQMTIYIMAGEGDIYALSTEDYKTYAVQGAFVDLTPYIESGALNVDGIDLLSGYVTLQDEDGVNVGEPTLYGIPLYTLSGMKDKLKINNSDMVISVTAFSGNEENAVAFLNGLLQAWRAAE